jgi:hypothetical protein
MAFAAIESHCSRNIGSESTINITGQYFAASISEFIEVLVSRSAKMDYKVPFETQKELFEIATTSYKWNQDSRMNILLCDFDVQIDVYEGTHTKFQADKMALLDGAKPPRNGEILVPVGLGVRVYSVDNPNGGWLVPVDVLYVHLFKFAIHHASECCAKL